MIARQRTSLGVAHSRTHAQGNTEYTTIPQCFLIILTMIERKRKYLERKKVKQYSTLPARMFPTPYTCRISSTIESDMSFFHRVAVFVPPSYRDRGLRLPHWPWGKRSASMCPVGHKDRIAIWINPLVDQCSCMVFIPCICDGVSTGCIDLTCYHESHVYSRPI